MFELHFVVLEQSINQSIIFLFYTEMFELHLYECMNEQINKQIIFSSIVVLHDQFCSSDKGL